MASFSKASQGVLRALKPWLGIPDSLLGHAEDDSDEDDDSIWRLPSQGTTLVGSQASAGSNSTVLKHHRSATDSECKGDSEYKGWSRSLRSLAARFYAEENINPSGPSDHSVPNTPVKIPRKSPRKPLPWIRSSVRSRGANTGKFSANDHSVSDDGEPSAMTIAPTTAPVLNVDIPKSNLAVDTEDYSTLADENLIKAYRSNQNRISGLLAQRAENCSASPLPTQDSEQVMCKIGWIFPVAGNPNDAYQELLKGPPNSSASSIVAKASSSNGKTRMILASTVIFADQYCYKPDPDVEDNDEDEEYGGAGILEFHAAAKSKPPLSPHTHTENPSSTHPNGESTERTIPLSHYLKTPSPPSKTRSMLRKSQSIRKNLNRLQKTLAGSLKGRPALKPFRAPSYASDADAENSEEVSPPCPSMGSRHEWQSRRIERNRRYAEAVADRPATEDDSESGEESLQLSRSPTARKSMDPPFLHRKSGGTPTGAAHDYLEQPSSSNTNALRYAIEANERLCADELSVRNLRYAIEAIDRPSAMDLYDNFHRTAAAKPPHMMIIPSPDSQDPYEAALHAAGLQPDRRQCWIPTLESLRELDDTVAGGSIASVAVMLDGVNVRGTSINTGLLGVAMGDLRPIRQGSEEELKVYNSVASSEDAGEEGGEGGVGVEAVGHEQAAWTDDSGDRKAGEKTQARRMFLGDSGASAGESDGGSSQDDTISID